MLLFVLMPNCLFQTNFVAHFGIGTMLAENPRLNARLVEGRNPAAIVVDSHLRTPAEARVFGCHEQTWLATTNAPVAANGRATPKGASLIVTAPAHGPQ